MESNKIAGMAAIAWAVGNVGVGMAAGQPPELDASAGEIRTYLADHRSMMLASVLVFALTLPALLAFFGEVLGRMRSSEQTLGMLDGGAGAALGVFATGFGLAYVLALPLVLDDSLRNSAPDGLVAYLWMGTFLVMMIGNVGMGVLLLAIGANTAATTRPTRLAATAIGAITVAVSAAGMVNTQATLVAGLCFLLVGLWMIAVGVGMVRAERTATVPTLTPAGA